MNTQKLYIISFGDSREYRLEIECPDGPENCTPCERLTAIEKELNDYLKSEFAQTHFKYYTTPKIEEVDWANRDLYMSYPLLDDKAIAEIKRVLRREVKDMNSVKKLNNNEANY